MEMARRITPRKPVKVYLAEWRRHCGLSQEEMGAHIRPPVPKGTVSRWEKMTRAPSLDVIAAYAEALRIAPADLYRLPSDEESLDEMVADAPESVRRTVRAAVQAILKSGR